ncbi:hypothetical protein ACRALDRAFT_1007572, partial [Sodiomyces alcalophilus JCM 7366]|uniref:uncharacterized protein n=1 Tax=Sodiomyces alcalophilus JCM 7366 TaxID=591952 RepID=UPI0039B4C220
MTLDVSRPVQGVPPEHVREADPFASLWEAAPFARLPPDAPAELKDLVQDLDNPKRVYAIHRASRRHNFQLLVERYITQLRYGCDSDVCTTSTCFTCRRRIVGKAPIRRYNPTSARILAVYLASQDNPERGFCPYLKSPKEPPAALDSLVFSPKRPAPLSSDPFSQRRSRSTTTRKVSAAHKSPSPNRTTTDKEETAEECGPDVPSRNRMGRAKHGDMSYIDSNTDDVQPSFKVTERPISKDHRSFSANLFSTVAFKMIEWLTPNSLESMSRKVDEALKGEVKTNEGPGADCTTLPTPSTSDDPTSLSASRPHSEEGRHIQPLFDKSQKEPSSDANGPERSTPTVPPPLPRSTSKDRPRRKSSAKVRAACNTTSSRRVSMETITPGYSDGPAPAVSSPRLNGAMTDKAARPPKTRAIPDVSPSSSLFDERPPRPHEAVPSDLPKSKPEATTNGVENGVSDDRPSQSPVAMPPRRDQRTTVVPPPEKTQPIDEALPDGFLPQSLTSLNVALVDFVCDVLQDDGTSEQHLFEPPQIIGQSLRVAKRPRAMRRVEKGVSSSYPRRLKTQWKYFIEQSLFNVLSDPKKLIASFTQNGELLDSYSSWYCMLRLTRVAPTLVFDGLWIAAASLFGPPKSLQSLQSPTTKVFRKLERSLTNAEAGHLIAICLHALVAAAPLVTDTRALHDMSKIRSNGLTLAGGGSTATRLCLQYHDVFSDDLLLRLARRLFLAISARRCFAEMAVPDEEEASERWGEDHDALRPLLSQLDLVGIPSVSGGLQPIQAERELHEARSRALLLDWAKTVILNEWDGEPVISFNSPLGGALTLLAAMYEKRQSLLLGDAQFRIDYFADRLDSIDVPVAWLSHNASRRNKHLLDYPFIFNPSALVSYFRSINLVRMSQSHEEASSLQSRIKAIIARDGLIKDAHHRLVLQEMMKTASSKYLILEISRDHVVRDAFDQLWQREERELLRPLKVHLGEDDGEEGFDSGGVQQEFFRLAMEECLNPDYGAFTVDERTHMAWFVPGSVVPTWKFEMIGVLVSLAVYNGLTLPVTFPRALYRKLLGEPVDELHHIADGWPELASGLTELLEWDETKGAVEDIFVRTYEFSVDMLGQPISREMNAENTSWPQLGRAGDDDEEAPSAQNPEDAPLVTHENRNAYVSDYIRYLADVSVRPQFEAFARGFRACLHPKSLALLTPGLLQSMVEGVQEIDIGELRRYARYVGWDASHRAVRDFWSIVKRYDDEMKRKLLEFVTASDRVPVGGMRNLQFVVQKNGEED